MSVPVMVATQLATLLLALGPAAAAAAAAGRDAAPAHWDDKFYAARAQATSGRRTNAARARVGSHVGAQMRAKVGAAPPTPDRQLPPRRSAGDQPDGSPQHASSS